MKFVDKKVLLTGITLCIFFLVGCRTAPQGDSQANKTYTTASAPIYYYTLQRTITVDPHTPLEIQPGLQTMTEILHMLLTVDQSTVADDGTQTLHISFKSIDADQTDFVGEHIPNGSVANLEGKSFTLKIANNGTVLDDSELTSLLKEAANRSLERKRKILLKRPDMLSDVEAIPYTVFAVAVKVHSENDFTKKQQFTLTEPTPWPVGYVRIPDHSVAGTVAKIHKENGCKKAVINETYAFVDDNVLDKPSIYPAEYRMDGLFGYMRKFNFESISGTGEMIYNMDTKQLEERTQNYSITGTAAFTMPIKDANPTIMINQTTTIKLINQ